MSESERIKCIIKSNMDSLQQFKRKFSSRKEYRGIESAKELSELLTSVCGLGSVYLKNTILTNKDYSEWQQKYNKASIECTNFVMEIAERRNAGIFAHK